MALPVILVNSSTGSDTQASGAGPATALFGTTDASTDGAGTTVTLTAGTNLTGVATDGSHVIYLADTTAGNRNFGKITGSAGSGGATPTVTVSNAFGINLTTKSWAIGGKRATLSSATSKKIYDNNGAAGDAKPGWIVEMEDGFTDTFSATFRIRCIGDQTTGPIIFRSASGYTTQPEISVNVADYACEILSANVQVQNFSVKRTGNCTYGIVANSVNYSAIIGMKVSSSSGSITNDGIYLGANVVTEVRGCTVLNAGRYGISVNGDTQGINIFGNTITSPANHGIFLADGTTFVVNNLITGAGGDGIRVDVSSTAYRRTNIIGNTIDSATSDGIEFSANADSTTASLVANNILSNNGAYGLNYSASADAVLTGGGTQVVNNNTYNNTSGAYKSTTSGYAYNVCPWASGDSNLNPTFTGGGNYTPGNTNLKGTEYPTIIGGATSYGYPGPITPNATGGGGGGPVIGGMVVRGLS